MTINRKKIEIELLKIQAALLECECKVIERQDEIVRIQENHRLLSDKQVELVNKIEELKVKGE